MAENSKIEWTHHTFNPWWGCTKVSPGCDNCYAEALDKRTGGEHWGPRAERRRTSEQNWNQPRKWNKALEGTGRRERVFCASMADVFDNAVPVEWRVDLWKLIYDTPNLDWLLLTKRIGNVKEMLPIEVSAYAEKVLPNIWLGISVVNQEEADRDIPKLLEIPASIRFLSMEPLLGQVDISQWLFPFKPCSDCPCPEPEKSRDGFDECCRDPQLLDSPIDWVIVGGESGPGARPMHPVWAREIMRQCGAASVPFFFKQWGEWGPFPGVGKPIHCFLADGTVYDSRKPDMWLDKELQCMSKQGKKHTGRALDGVHYDEFPVKI